MVTPYTRTRILGNAHNKVRAAVITASAQRPSTQMHLLSQTRAGNGSMGLSGAYTGGADSVVDVEVLGGPDGEMRTSSPVLQGVGNGTVEVQSIDVGAVPQTLRFTLLDAGEASTPAMLDFFGVQLAARAAGAAGNNIELTVTRSLAYTDLPYSTLDAIGSGTASFEGPQFDWGQPLATAPRCPWVPCASLSLASPKCCVPGRPGTRGGSPTGWTPLPRTTCPRTPACGP